MVILPHDETYIFTILKTKKTPRFGFAIYGAAERAHCFCSKGKGQGRSATTIQLMQYELKQKPLTIKSIKINRTTYKLQYN